VISKKQLLALLALTLMWGINWPMMKLSLRELSPMYFRACTMSVMAIPLVGTLSASVIVGEWPHWQDFVAIVFVMAAIAAVLLPPRAQRLQGEPA